MSVKYVFKVGPANRHSGYADAITVYADDYSSARAKAIELRGYNPRDSNTWFISADEVDPKTEVIERLDRLERLLRKDIKDD
jgi:hypothetical protein